MTETGTPTRDPLPWYLAPVPTQIEDIGLRLAWGVVAINLAGTAFGFWYYAHQFGETVPALWPWIPDSPLATLFIALAIAAWKLGHELPWLTAIAFFGNIVLGLWTPYTLIVFRDGFAGLHPLMFQFLFWSHLAMVVQALVLHRITDFPPWALGIATVWYWSNLVVDYFVPIVGQLHHTTIPVPRDHPVAFGADALSAIAVAEVTFVLLAVCLAFTIRSRFDRSAPT